MKIFNSIRWRLQIWYGLILVAVLVSFGLTAYQLERGRQLRRFDEELQRRVSAVATALRMTQHDHPPGDPMRDRPPPGHQPPEHPFGPQADFYLPPRDAGLFDETDTNDFYFVLWVRDGSELARSTNAPADLTMPSHPHHPDPTPDPPRMHGTFREIVLITPPGDIILVGRSMANDLRNLRLNAVNLSLAGFLILFMGLSGGWWYANRAIRPIQDISTAAVKIAAGDLSQRINTAETESELDKLAAVLNSTFARLETSFAQQQQFTSDAAHELRTPVSVILTQTQTTLNRERSSAEYRETLEACQRSAQRMRRLIVSLLELARLDAGQEQMKRMKFDLAVTVRDNVDLIHPLSDERGIKILTELAPVECLGDPERLGQVITNLLTNAIQYNRIGGQLKLALKKENELAVLTVSDTGIGISPENLPHVFERFYRGDKSRSGSNGHAGLGLAICKAVVEAHGGTIEVSSEPEEGTTFTVRLPTA